MDASSPAARRNARSPSSIWPRLALPGPALRIGITPGISEEDFFATDKRPFPYGVHVAAVEVDNETGKIKILDYLVTEDVGRKINPMIIEGQMAGGLAQGIGGALLEEFVYNEDGQPLSTNFMDYLLPTAMEMPKAQLISTEDFPSPHNPLGVKGAGEGGITAAGAALANAVSDSLGVEVTKLPLRPDFFQLVKPYPRHLHKYLPYASPSAALRPLFGDVAGGR